MREKLQDAEKVVNDAEENYNALLVQCEEYWNVAVLRVDSERRVLRLVGFLENEAVHYGCELIEKAEKNETLTEVYWDLQDRWFYDFSGSVPYPFISLGIIYLDICPGF